MENIVLSLMAVSVALPKSNIAEPSHSEKQIPIIGFTQDSSIKNTLYLS